MRLLRDYTESNKQALKTKLSRRQHVFFTNYIFSDMWPSTYLFFSFWVNFFWGGVQSEMDNHFQSNRQKVSFESFFFNVTQKIFKQFSQLFVTVKKWTYPQSNFDKNWGKMCKEAFKYGIFSLFFKEPDPKYLILIAIHSSITNFPNKFLLC